MSLVETFLTNTAQLVFDNSLYGWGTDRTKEFLVLIGIDYFSE
jgi:hypothetical protein